MPLKVIHTEGSLLRRKRMILKELGDRRSDLVRSPGRQNKMEKCPPGNWRQKTGDRTIAERLEMLD